MIISRESLMSLEAYHKARPEMRKQIIEHKKIRTVQLGNHVSLLFEDEMTLARSIRNRLPVDSYIQ